jgi:dTDP-L-rhamnose 4-epimerase
MYEITRYVDANSLGTALLWQLLAHEKTRVTKVMVASSMSIYGEGAYSCPRHGCVSPPLRAAAQLHARDWELRCPLCGEALTPLPTPEDKPLAPASTYAITKRDQEELSLTLGRAYNLPTVAFRFFNVYGSRQALSNPYTGAIAMFGARLKNGHAPLVYEDGSQTRDFIHVGDIVRVLVRALESANGDGNAFNVGTGEPRTISSVARTLAEVMGLSIEPEVTQQFRAGDVRHCFADTTRVRAAYDFEPQCAFEDGVREWWEWAQREPADDRVPDANLELVARRLVV